MTKPSSAAQRRRCDALRATDSAAWLLERVTSLAADAPISARRLAAMSRSIEPDDGVEAALLAKEGYALLDDLGAGERGLEICRQLAQTMTRLVDEELPAVLIYLLDAPWAIGERLRARVSTLLRTPYVLAADGWGWWLPAGTGRGWEPHRDDGRLLDRRAPERVNIWLALTDAFAEGACIHAVPLDDDPGYPSRLDEVTAPLSAVRAVPVRAGTALAWNANLLHWGGRSSQRARGPRIAISFTAVRADAVESLQLTVLTEDGGSRARRVDLVASFIAAYEDHVRSDFPADVMTWAKATSALAERARYLGLAEERGGSLAFAPK